MRTEHTQPSPGREPWDPLTGFRVGTVAGALAGAVLSIMLGLSIVWMIVGSGAIGGGVGYWSRRRRQRSDRRR